MISLTIKGPSQAKMYNAIRDLFDLLWPNYLPNNGNNFINPWIKSGYRVDVHVYYMIVLEIDGNGNIINSWDRGWHSDWGLDIVDPSKIPVEERFKTLKTTAKLSGDYTKVDDDTPQDMLDYLGTTVQKVWQTPNGCFISLDPDPEYLYHRFWGCSDINEL